MPEAVNGFPASCCSELPISDHVLVFQYQDRTGVVGDLGRILGQRNINIAGMQVARQNEGGQVLCLLTVDTAVPSEVVEEIRAAVNADLAREVNLEG